MKYLIVVPDGAGGDPYKDFGGKTSLQMADMEMTKYMAQRGEVGLVKTIPDGIAPGSDAANLSVMGYDPSIYLTGRSPLEVASIGIDMEDSDVSFRVNLVTLEGEGDYDELTMIDHSSGDITTEEADKLISALKKEFEDDSFKLYTGVSYRHCLIWKNGEKNQNFVPPHDILGQNIKDSLPSGDGSERLKEMMEKSYKILSEHEVNIARVKKGLRPANSMWIWGQGTKPKLDLFSDRYSIKGSVISAVDLIKGIGICAGLDSIEVENATGTLHTNFEGKADAACNEFDKGKDFVYVHLEGPDECSHQGDAKGKLTCLKDIDQKVIKRIVNHLEDKGEDFKVLIVPDHRTPLNIRTHSADPVPFVLYDSTKVREPNLDNDFTEESGKMGSYFDSGFKLADYFFKG